MRTGLIVLGAALVLAGTISTAEARFRGGRSVHAPRSAPGGIGLGVGVGVSLPLRPARASAIVPGSASDRPVTLRPILPVLAPAPAVAIQEVRSAGPWCSDKRLVGSGSGFCQIN